MSFFTKVKNILSVSIMTTMLLSTVSVASAAKSSDADGHWAQDNLRKWVDSGLLQGYDDGSIQPDRPVTRAELMTLINRSFELKEKQTVSFTDLPSSGWAAEQVAIAVKAGYVKGYEDGTIRWNEQVTREEAASMVAQLLEMDDSVSTSAQSFDDASSIGGWSKASVGALVDAKIISGYPSGLFVPKGKFTRAQSVTVLEKALHYIKSGVEYSTAGVYGPEKGAESIKGNLIVSAPGVVLRNMVIEGDLTLTAAIGEGDVHLDKVTVKGKTNIAGGGSKSVHLRDSVLVHITVNKQSGAVRIVAEGSTDVQSVVLQSASIVEEKGLTGAGFTAVQLAKELSANEEVKFLGSFTDVNVYAASVRLQTANGSIDKLTVHDSAAEAVIQMDVTSKILNMVLDAAAKLSGQGVIEKAVINKGGAKTVFEKQPAKVEGEGAVPEAPVIVGGGGNGGGDGVVVPNTQLKSIRIDGYALKQKPADPDQEAREGFDSEHSNYEIMVPNNVALNDLKLRTETTGPGTSVTVMLEKMKGYDVAALQTDTDGNLYYPIPLQIAKHQYVTIESKQPSGQVKRYSLLVKRLPNAPVADRNKLDETDILVEHRGIDISLSIPPIPATVTVSVYDSADRKNLLIKETVVPKKGFGIYHAYVFLNTLPQIGAIWISVINDDTGEDVFLKKEYMILDSILPIYNGEMSGDILRPATAEEVAKHNAETINPSSTGAALTLYKEQLPEQIRNFAYLRFEQRNSIVTPFYSQQERAYHGATYDPASDAWTTLTFFEFSSEQPKGYRIIFYDRNDVPLGGLFFINNLINQ